MTNTLTKKSFYNCPQPNTRLLSAFSYHKFNFSLHLLHLYSVSTIHALSHFSHQLRYKLFAKCQLLHSFLFFQFMDISFELISSAILKSDQIKLRTQGLYDVREISLEMLRFCKKTETQRLTSFFMILLHVWNLMVGIFYTCTAECF